MRHSSISIVGLLAACAPGCVTFHREVLPIQPVQAMTSEDSAAQRLAFENRHGGRLSRTNLVPDANRTLSRLTAHQWQGPRVTVATLASYNPNAFVLASGHVYLTAGLLDLICTEDDLAAVLAHEMAHLENADGFSTVDLTLEDRLHIEVEADCRAADRLMHAGYEPAALIDMIQRLSGEQADGWASRRRDALRSYMSGEAASRDADHPGSTSFHYSEALLSAEH